MEQMHISLSGKNDIEKMTKARVEYCLRNSPNIDKKEYDAFYQQVKVWVENNAKAENFVTYFGDINNEIISFAGVLMFTLPPIYGKDERKEGYILTFYTYPKYRKMGYGKQLMEHIQKDAINLEIDDLVLKATSDGEHLYRICGFHEPSMPYLEYKIETKY